MKKILLSAVLLSGLLGSGVNAECATKKCLTKKNVAKVIVGVGAAVATVYLFHKYDLCHKLKLDKAANSVKNLVAKIFGSSKDLASEAVVAPAAEAVVEVAVAPVSEAVNSVVEAAIAPVSEAVNSVAA